MCLNVLRSGRSQSVADRILLRHRTETVDFIRYIITLTIRLGS